MGQKLVVGPFNKGLRNDVTPFNVDQDSFPTLINAYQWRGRVKRKRGTSYLNRLQRFLYDQSLGTSGVSPWSFNLFSDLVPPVIPESDASIVLGSVEIVFTPSTLTGNIVAPGYTISNDCQVFTTSTAGLQTGDEVTISGVDVVPGTGADLINGGPYTIEVIDGTSFKLGVSSVSPLFGTWQSGGTWTKIVGTIEFSDQGDGTLTSATPGNSGTINYVTGDVTLIHTGGAGIPVGVSFSYYPALPVMGLEDFENPDDQFPETIAFDTKYSYYVPGTFPFTPHDVTYYKNPATGTYAGYTEKAVLTPFTWNGEDYQQFWSTNYEGSLWVTNGITIPFTEINIGMQYKPIETVNVTSPTTAILEITGHGLVIGDFVFVNEVQTTTGINFQTGYVTDDTIDVDHVEVTFPNAVLTTNGTGGIAQYLTNTADATKDPIRFFDGDPTTGNKGWVNFSPPLNYLEQFPAFSVGGLAPAQYYLAGARMIIPFKDRLLFIGPVVQTSSPGSQRYLQDTVIYSQNGTPYYTTSYTNTPSATVDTPTSVTNVFNPLLVPDDQVANSPAWFEDTTGFGGFQKAAVNQPITTVSQNEDVLIFGFDPSIQARFIYTGNDIVPFNFFLVNSELGSESTFSAISLDKGVITRGARGFIITSQNEAVRIDLVIPDEVFSMNLENNGPQRLCAQRDFINEWIYFTFPYSQFSDPPSRPNKFPNRTLFYNYRDQSWAINNESYTHYGSFRKRTGYTWATIGIDFASWSVWNEPWNAGSTTLLQPMVIAGNQQGFIVFRDDGTNESNSLQIINISFPTTITGVTLGNPTILQTVNNFTVGQFVRISQVVGTTELNGNLYEILAATPTSISIDVNSTAFTPYISGGVITPFASIYSPNHGLNVGDYIMISGALGTIGSEVNGKVFSVGVPIDDDSFQLNPTVGTGTYIGGGLIKRMYIPLIQTMQFPTAWDMSRKTRIGAQQYLLTTTSNAQISLQIYLSQNADSPYNIGPIYPDPNSINDSLIYTSILYTCPESTNLGLSPANINLQMVTAQQQAQIWHRVNTSLLGDTVQLGFTLSDTQMRTLDSEGKPISQFAEIELHGFILDLNSSMVLA